MAIRLRRLHAEIVRDLKNGFVTAAAGRADYGFSSAETRVTMEQPGSHGVSRRPIGAPICRVR